MIPSEIAPAEGKEIGVRISDSPEDTLKCGAMNERKRGIAFVIVVV